MSTTGDSGWLSTNNSAIKQKLSWEITTGNAISNSSSVTLRFYLIKDPNIQNLTTYSTDSNFTLSCDGQTYYVSGATRNVYADNVAYEMVSHTFTVSHSIDGTKSATFAVSGGLGGTSIYYYTLQISRTVTFPSITRNSSIDSFANFTFGEQTSVKFTPKNASFRYKIKFKLNSYEYTTGAIFPNSTSQYVYNVTFENYSAWLPRIPDSTSGTMVAYLYTYSDESCNTQIGSAQSKSCIATVPVSVVPILNSVSITSVNSNSVISGWGINVEGYTRFRIVGNASGVYGSTISSFIISGAYSSTVNASSLDYTGLTLNGNGEKTFSVKAVDSRGRSTSVFSESKTVYQYSRPVVTACSVSRDTNDSTKAIARINCTYSSCNGNNILSIGLKYKSSDSASYTTISDDISANTDIELPVTLSEDTKYNFVFTISDSIMSSDGEYIYKNIDVQTASVLLDFRRGGNGFGIGRVCATDSFEIALPTKFYNDIYIYDSGTDTEITLRDYILSVVS